jgi:hypothetical protein
MSITKGENGEEYGDVLYEIIDNNKDRPNVVTFRYVIGARLNSNNQIIKPNFNANGDITNEDKITGIHYEESYIFSEMETVEPIDGKDRKIKYKQINYGLNIDNGSTNVILSKIRYKPEDVWNEDTAVTLPTFRKDYLIGLSEYPSEDVNITIDRGLSHAFEKHLMLCETNTFNDLKNYKNNYFNLQ